MSAAMSPIARAAIAVAWGMPGKIGVHHRYAWIIRIASLTEIACPEPNDEGARENEVAAKLIGRCAGARRIDRRVEQRHMAQGNVPFACPQCGADGEISTSAVAANREPRGIDAEGFSAIMKPLQCRAAIFQCTGEYGFGRQSIVDRNDDRTRPQRQFATKLVMAIQGSDDEPATMQEEDRWLECSASKGSIEPQRDYARHSRVMRLNGRDRCRVTADHRSVQLRAIRCH